MGRYEEAEDALREAVEGPWQGLRLVPGGDEDGDVLERLVAACGVRFEALAGAPRPPRSNENDNPGQQSGDRPAEGHQATRSDLSRDTVSTHSSTAWLSELS